MDRNSYQQTLEFIEQTCVPELEDYDLTIGEATVQIAWPAKEIMRGWFLDHKKHNMITRLKEIVAREAEDLLSLESLPGDHTLSEDLPCESTKGIDTHQSSQEKGVHHELSHLVPHTDLSQKTEIQHQSAHTYQSFKQRTAPYQSDDPESFIAALNSPISRTIIVGTLDHPSVEAIVDKGNPSLSDMQVSPIPSKTILLQDESPSSNDSVHPSPEHKKWKKTPLVVDHPEDGHLRGTMTQKLKSIQNSKNLRDKDEVPVHEGLAIPAETLGIENFDKQGNLPLRTSS
ncbi:unnamed protein product [Calypogeia fissa]